MTRNGFAPIAVATAPIAGTSGKKARLVNCSPAAATSCVYPFLAMSRYQVVSQPPNQASAGGTSGTTPRSGGPAAPAPASARPNTSRRDTAQAATGCHADGIRAMPGRVALSAGAGATPSPDP